MYTIVVFGSIFGFYAVYILFVSFDTFVQTSISTKLRNWADKQTVDLIQFTTDAYLSVLGFRKAHYFVGYIKEGGGFIDSSIDGFERIKDSFSIKKQDFPVGSKDERRVSRHLKRFDKIK